MEQNQNAGSLAFSQDQSNEIEENRSRLARAARMARLGYYEIVFHQKENTYWSNELYEIFDVSSEAGPPSALRLLDIVHPEDSPRLQAALESHWQSLTFNFRLLTRSGQTRYCRSENERIFSPSGRVTQQYGIVQDITAQVEADRRATRAEDRLRDAIESLPDGFVLYDSRGKLVLVNDTVRHMFIGLPPRFFRAGTQFRTLLSAILDHDFIDLGVDTREDWFRQRELAFHNKISPFPMRTKNGRFYLLYNHPTGEGGTVIVAHDVTELKEQERKQIKIEKRLEDAHRIGRIGHWEMDFDLTRMTWSPNMYVVTGQTPHFVATYENYLSIMHPEDRRQLEDIKRHPTDHSLFEGEWRVLGADGAVRWIHAQWTLEKDPETGQKRYFGINQDITERKQVELALRKSEENLKMAQRLANLGHFEYVPGQDEMLWSDQQKRIWGLTADGPSDLEGVMRTIHPEDKSTLIAKLGERGPDSFALDTRILRPNGELRHIHVEAYRERSLQGDTKRFFGIVQDISETVQRQKDLKRMAMRNAFLRAAIEASPVAIAVADGGMDNFPILYANEAFARMSGYEIDDCLGQPLDFLQGPGTDPDSLDALRKSFELGKMAEVEMLCYHQDGRAFRNLIELAPVYDEQGEQIAFVSVQKDVTILRQQEDELRQGQKLEALGRLAGGISHELSNMLQPIMTFSGLALRRDQDQTTEKYLRSIQKSAGKARDIVRNVLAFSRKDAPAAEAIFLSEAIQEILNFARSVLPPQVEIVEDLSKAPLSACVGTTELTQVIVNLLNNAADAMSGQGKITVRLEQVTLAEMSARLKDRVDLFSEMEADFFACLSVRDRGSGMEEDVRSRIFDPFFTTKPVGRGTGLGLSVIYGIVQAWGGHIGVESACGQGTKFDIFIPLDPLLKA